MNIHEIARRSAVPLSSLKKLERLGVLKVDASDPMGERIRRAFANRQPLTLEMLLACLDQNDDALFYQLGAYEDRARLEVDKLGDVKAAPRNVTAHVPQAAKGDADGVKVLAQWLGDVLPAVRVPFAWIGVRLLVDQTPTQRAMTLRSVNLALNHVRRLDAFKPYWQKDGDRIFYRQPLARHDL